MGKTVLVLAIFSTWTTFQAKAASRSVAFDVVQSISRLKSGDIRGAAVEINQARLADPNDRLINDMTGALWTMVGADHRANWYFNAARAENPNDAIANYGLVLHLISEGRFQQALLRLNRIQNGDVATLSIARKYLYYLLGNVNGASGLALPDVYEAQVDFFNGLSAEHQKNWSEAYKQYRKAFWLLGTNPTSEPIGILMTLNPKLPLATGFSQSLPIPKPTVRFPSRKDALHGVVSLTPGNLGGDFQYLVFRIDGHPLTILNRPPYQYLWDTSKEANGSHTIELITYGANAQVIGRSTRQAYTLNPDAPPAASQLDDEAAMVKAELWQLVALQPSRAVLSDRIAQVAQELGDKSRVVSKWLERSIALDPSRRLARKELMADSNEAELALWKGDPKDKGVALTFDDGPKPGITPALLAILDANGTPATFFVIGRHVVKHPNLVKMMVQDGMEVENHSYSHPDLALLTPDGVDQELLKANVAIQAAGAPRPQFFRPPGGDISPMVIREADRWGLTPVFWTVDAEKMEYPPIERLAHYIVNKARDGAIILLHNGRSATVQALPEIIAGLKARGFRFVLLRQLVATAENRTQLTRGSEINR
ncbi:MAG: polysaccharide deacetylase family protein [Armatimonadetes bacterium]|nr:polysaccharide deacetylase family protein [Armatimonadota bacterium]